MAEFADLVGKTIVEIKGGKAGDDEIIFICDGGEKYQMYHNQDCCESVSVEDVCGDFADVIGLPILLAEEREQDDENASESGTWTFYELATNKGRVTIRWYGCSNGYYSESVDFDLMRD